MRRRTRSASGAARCLVAVGVVAAALVALPAAPAGAADPWTVTVTPTTGVVDGQRVSINIKTTAEAPIERAEVRLCRHGVVYQPSDGNRPAPDFEIPGPNCPSKPISSSAEYTVAAGMAAATLPEGRTFTFRLGSGIVDWQDGFGTPFRLQCDENNPCTLVVQIRVRVAPGKYRWIPMQYEIRYRPDDPIAGCGGPAKGVLTTTGPDFMSDAWINWTLDYCRRAGAAGAPGRGIFGGEGEGVIKYADGQADLAYTAVGFDKDVGLVPTDTPDRASVAVPVGINGVVLAASGGVPDPETGQIVPYQRLQFTLDEVATLVAGGEPGITPVQGPLLLRNPDLLAWGLFAQNSQFRVGAASTTESTSFFASRYFHARAPGAWRVPDVGTFYPDQGRPRAISTSFALADPNFRNALDTITGRSPLKKAVSDLGPGAGWVLTDLETAHALGMTTVDVQWSAGGSFVGPTPTSMLAAVATMKKDDAGFLLPPDPAAGGTGSAVGTGATATEPYPLTFVQYAMVPAEPLVDTATCTSRKDSQALLDSWLRYITTDGQAKLPGGMLPLTDALKADAAAAIEKVGKSAVTGACAGKVDKVPDDGTGPGDTGGNGSDGGNFADLGPGGGFGSDLDPGGYLGGGAGGGGAGGGGSGSGYAGSGSTGGGSGGSAAPGGAKESAAVELAAAGSGVPPFGGAGSVGGVLALIGVLGIVALTSGAALLSSRWFSRPDPTEPS